MIQAIKSTRKNILCEKCGKNEAWAFGFFRENNRVKCYCVCECTNEEEFYYVEFDRYFNDQRKVHSWDDHLKVKNWFDEEDFKKAVCRITEKENQ